VDAVARPWWESLEAAHGPLPLFDAHTHIGRNDPDGYRQEPAELLAALAVVDARAAVFAMQEPDGYREANDFVIAAAADSAGVLVPYCRINPHHAAVAEAERALDAGARGIKLHPRAEAFTLDLPAVRDLVAIAHERRLPVLIHAGRGIPALGRHSLELGGEFGDARLILAHAAVSDLAWLWREMPSHPNLLIDTSWWNPADLLALFRLVPPGQILWASDSPYLQPLPSAAIHLRYAVEAGLGDEALRSIAGAQMERILARDELLRPPGPAAEPAPLDPLLERVVSHLVSAVGVAVAGGDPDELLALATLACAVEAGPYVELCAEIAWIIDRARENFPQPDRLRFFTGARLIAFAIAIARTPNTARPAIAPSRRLGRDEAG
jgi:predicted TIM-barrel fold metal-dependent hydrolase